MSEKQKVLLLVPPTGRFIREERCQTPIEDLKTVTLRPPIGLLYAAASFEKAECECRLVDLPAEHLTWEHLRKEVEEYSPDIAVLSITTPSIDSDMKAAELIKETSSNTLVTAIGAHFNTLDIESLEKYPSLDLVFRGEYEETCQELGKNVKKEHIKGITYKNTRGKVLRNPERPFVNDLDTLPFPARHLAKNELYIRPDTMKPQTTILTNRGCSFDCIFCLSRQVAGSKNRIRSVDNIIDEIRECIEKNDIRNFLFRSDTFTANKKWVAELCQRIRDEGLNIAWASNSRVDTVDLELLKTMKEAGCWLIAYGVETASQDILDKMNKKTNGDTARFALRITREAGLKSSIYLLFGLPWDTITTLRDNIEFAKELDPDFFEIFYAYPFPGTSLSAIAVDKGLLKRGEYPTDAYSAPAMPTLYMDKEQLAQWRRKALRAFYLRPRFILRTLTQAGSFNAMFHYIKYGCIQLADLVAKK